MPHKLSIEIREEILKEARAQSPTDSGGNLQSGSVLNAVKEKFSPRSTNREIEQAILTVFHDLMRTGVFAWGLDISNPNPPFFHFTTRGRKALERLSRDPSNPSGYLRHIESKGQLCPVSNAYLLEALECYNANLINAAAVMLGCASESLILSLRDQVVEKMNSAAIPVPKKLDDWRIKTVIDSLFSYFNSNKSQFEKTLEENFDAYWTAFGKQIRTTRNEAGHPKNIDTVTEESVHASFLIFPEQASLIRNLGDWLAKEPSRKDKF